MASGNTSASIVFYKYESEFDNDTLKQKGLLGDDIDSNFYNLKVNDIEDMCWCGDTNTLILKKYNGSTIEVNDISPFSFEVDEETGAIVFKHNGEVFDINASVVTDNTLEGDGTPASPLGIGTQNLTGTYKPVNRYYASVDDLDDEEHNYGERFLVKNDNSTEGLLYTYQEAKEIDEYLKSIDSGWRVATIDDWDNMLNAVEDCDECKDHITDEDGKICGTYSGIKLKSVDEWEKYTEDWGDTYGMDVYGFNIIPSGFVDENGGEPFDDNQCAYFWAMNTGETEDGAYAYGKGFQYDLAGTRQITITDETSPLRMAIRLVKDDNYVSSEYIINDIYTCMKMPAWKNGLDIKPEIWTDSNVTFTDLGNGIQIGQKSTKETEDEETKKARFFIYEWTTDGWKTNRVYEGESVVIKEPIEDEKFSFDSYDEVMVKDGSLFSLTQKTLDIINSIASSAETANFAYEAGHAQSADTALLAYDALHANSADTSKNSDMLGGHEPSYYLNSAVTQQMIDKSMYGVHYLDKDIDYSYFDNGNEVYNFHISSANTIATGINILAKEALGTLFDYEYMVADGLTFLKDTKVDKITCSSGVTATRIETEDEVIYNITLNTGNTEGTVASGNHTHIVGEEITSGKKTIHSGETVTEALKDIMVFIASAETANDSLRLGGQLPEYYMNSGNTKELIESALSGFSKTIGSNKVTGMTEYEVINKNNVLYVQSADTLNQSIHKIETNIVDNEETASIAINYLDKNKINTLSGCSEIVLERIEDDAPEQFTLTYALIANTGSTKGTLASGDHVHTIGKNIYTNKDVTIASSTTVADAFETVINKINLVTSSGSVINKLDYVSGDTFVKAEKRGGMDGSQTVYLTVNTGKTKDTLAVGNHTHQEIDTISGITKTLSGNVETLSAVTATLSGNTKVLSGATGELSGVTKTLSGNMETLSAVTATLSGNTETLSGVTATLSGNVETLSGVTSTLSGNTESLSGVTKTLSGNTEILSGVTKTLSGNVETLSAVTATLSGDTETLSGVTTTLSGEVETLSGVTAVLSGNTENLSGVTATLSGNVETLSGATKEKLNYISGDTFITVEKLDYLEESGTGYSIKVITGETEDTLAVGNHTHIVDNELKHNDVIIINSAMTISSGISFLASSLIEDEFAISNSLNDLKSTKIDSLVAGDSFTKIEKEDYTIDELGNPYITQKIYINTGTTEGTIASGDHEHYDLNDEISSLKMTISGLTNYISYLISELHKDEEDADIVNGLSSFDNYYASYKASHKSPEKQDLTSADTETSASTSTDTEEATPDSSSSDTPEETSTPDSTDTSEGSGTETNPTTT